MQYTVSIRLIEDGWYMAKCDQIPSAITQGQTIEEALENIKDAIQMVLESEKELGIKRKQRKMQISRHVVTV